MTIQKLFVAAAAALLLSGASFAASQADADAAISAAKAANKGTKGAEWRDTGKMIKAAEAAAAEGKFDAAVSEAKDAEFQAKIAQQQAKGATNAGNPSYLYN